MSSGRTLALLHLHYWFRFFFLRWIPHVYWLFLLLKLSNLLFGNHCSHSITATQDPVVQVWWEGSWRTVQFELGKKKIHTLSFLLWPLPFCRTQGSVSQSCAFCHKGIFQCEILGRASRNLKEEEVEGSDRWQKMRAKWLHKFTRISFLLSSLCHLSYNFHCVMKPARAEIQVMRASDFAKIPVYEGV